LNQKRRAKDYYQYVLQNCDYSPLYEHIIRGCILELDSAALAREEYAKALAIDPNNYHASFYYGSLLADDKKFDEVIPYFLTAAKHAIFSGNVGVRIVVQLKIRQVSCFNKKIFSF